MEATTLSPENAPAESAPSEPVKVLFNAPEYAGLSRAADEDVRSLPLEVRHMVREVLRARGLLAA